MNSNLSGRAAIVSGGSGTIGEAVSRRLAAAGAAVLVTWNRAEERAESLVEDIRSSGGTAESTAFDQSNPSAASDIVKRAERLAPLGAVVANAVEWPEFNGDEIAALERSLAANTVGPVALINAALPAMRKQGWGRVILVSTDIVAQPYPGPVAYAAAKGALESVGRVLAVREAGHGILTNVVRPGYTVTEEATHDPTLGEGIIQETARTPTGRLSTPEDVASLVAFLVSEDNRHVNGQIVSVSGGREFTR